MVPSTFALAFLTTLAATTTHVAANPSGILHELVARQTFGSSSIPQQCEDICTGLLSSATASSCSTDIQCLCGKDIISKVQQCAQCDALVVGPDAAESLYQDYADACKEGGITIPSFTASGSGPPSTGNTGSTTSNAYSNLQLSVAGVVGSAALAFMIVAEGCNVS